MPPYLWAGCHQWLAVNGRIYCWFMGRKGRGYGYQQARKQMLAEDPWCQWCLAEGRMELATEADHQPPIALHDHVEGSGCCVLVPTCEQHRLRQVSTLNRMRLHKVRSQEVAEPEGTP